MKLSGTQKRFLLILEGKHIVRDRNHDGTVMPFRAELRTVASLEKIGMLRWVSAGKDGFTYNGVVITDAGHDALK